MRTSTRTTPVSPSAAHVSRAVGIFALAALAALVLGLVYYKWGASYAVVSATAQTGTTSLRADAYLGAGVVGGTVNYLKKVGIALTFGVLIGATLRVAVPAERVARFLGGRGAPSMLRGAVAGAPLMLCSCCVTPIFSSLHRSGARLGPALAVMLAAPGLNVGALALTFLLFPARFGLLRLAAALVLVLGVGTALGRIFDEGARRTVAPTACPVPDEVPLSMRNFAPRWFRSVLSLTLTTVPLVVVGVFLSSALGPSFGYLSAQGAILAIIGVAFVATLVALPTFLEIPIALSLVAAGAPGAAIAVLVAGPIVNLPSLFVLARDTSPRLAALLFVAVWGAAALCGVCLV